MRNSKVRQRIAAGKLQLRMRDLRNLGVKSERALAEIGIYTAEELRRQGAVRAFAELKRAGQAPSLNLLWALAGALEPWPEGRTGARSRAARRGSRCCWRSRIWRPPRRGGRMRSAQ